MPETLMGPVGEVLPQPGQDGAEAQGWPAQAGSHPSVSQKLPAQA